MEQTKNKWAYKKVHTSVNNEFVQTLGLTLNKIILKTPKAEIPKRNFSLLSNPLVLLIRLTIWKTKKILQLQSLKNLQFDYW
jgi:hypothetical protein